MAKKMSAKLHVVFCRVPPEPKERLAQFARLVRSPENSVATRAIEVYLDAAEKRAGAGQRIWEIGQ